MGKQSVGNVIFIIDIIYTAFFNKQFKFVIRRSVHSYFQTNKNSKEAKINFDESDIHIALN